MCVVLFALWKWPAWKALPLLAIFFIVDIAYFGANLIKVPDGGWVPLAIGLTIFTLLTTWSRGRKLMQQKMADGSMPIPVFVKSAANRSEEHTSELQSLMRISYDVFCLKKNKTH